MNMFNTIGKCIGKATQNIILGYKEGVQLAIKKSWENSEDYPYNEELSKAPKCDMQEPNAMSVEV